MRKKAIWLFGLSGAGKSTIANILIKKLSEKNIPCVLLDGDELRDTVNKDLGYSDADRQENIRRAAEFAKLLCHQNIKCICAFITPFKSLRTLVKSILKEDVILFWIDAPIEECIKRDVKGLYKKALNNEIENFTGISSNFEYPVEEEGVWHINTSNKSAEECAHEILSILTLSYQSEDK